MSNVLKILCNKSQCSCWGVFRDLLMQSWRGEDFRNCWLLSTYCCYLGATVLHLSFSFVHSSSQVPCAFFPSLLKQPVFFFTYCLLRTVMSNLERFIQKDLPKNNLDLKLENDMIATKIRGKLLVCPFFKSILLLWSYMTTMDVVTGTFSIRTKMSPASVSLKMFWNNCFLWCLFF